MSSFDSSRHGLPHGQPVRRVHTRARDRGEFDQPFVVIGPEFQQGCAEDEVPKRPRIYPVSLLGHGLLPTVAGTAATPPPPRANLGGGV